MRKFHYAAPMIRFENVGLRYGSGAEILSDLSFSLQEGSFTALTGPSGAGKTSLLKLTYLAERASRGLISVMGRNIETLDRKDLPALRQKIGIVFQDFRLLNHLTLFDNVALPLFLNGQSADQYHDNVMEMLDWIGLKGRANALPQVLSGGEQQRVAIARAVVTGPKLLVADEPTGNVDSEMGRDIFSLFQAMNKIGTTILIATHDEALAHEFGEQIITLDKGHATLKKTADTPAPPPGPSTPTPPSIPTLPLDLDAHDTENGTAP